MLKTEMIDKLNAQMNLELYSSLLYQQMSAWCSYHSFEGAAAFLRRHAQEEMTHMQRLFDYLTDTGSLPRIETVASPFAEYNSRFICSFSWSIISVFSMVLLHKHYYILTWRHYNLLFNYLQKVK